MAGPVMAVPMTDNSSYTIPSIIVTGGGTTEMGSASGTWRMTDLKGLAVVGSSSVEGFVLEIGGVIGTAPATEEEPPVEPFPETSEDNGMIYNTRIFRPDPTRDQIRVTWEFRTGVTRASVYVLGSDNAEFTVDPSFRGREGETWNYLISPAEGERIYNFVGVGNGENRYIRVVPYGVVEADIFGNDPVTGRPYNNRTVGKIDIELASDDIQLISLPMYAGQMGPALSGQLTAGQLIVYPQAGGGLGRIPYDGAPGGGEFTVGFNIEPTAGFWLENDENPRVLTFLGSFETLGSMPISDIDLSGNPVPYSLNSSGIGGQTGDILYPQAGGGLGRIPRSSTGWPSFTLTLGQGFWYEKTGLRTWNIDLYDPRETTITGP